MKRMRVRLDEDYCVFFIAVSTSLYSETCSLQTLCTFRKNTTGPSTIKGIVYPLLFNNVDRHCLRSVTSWYVMSQRAYCYTTAAHTTRGKGF